MPRSVADFKGRLRYHAIALELELPGLPADPKPPKNRRDHRARLAETPDASTSAAPPDVALASLGTRLRSITRERKSPSIQHADDLEE